MRTMLSSSQKFVKSSDVVNNSNGSKAKKSPMPKNQSFYIAPLVSDTIQMGGSSGMKSIITATRTPMYKPPSMSPKKQAAASSTTVFKSPLKTAQISFSN